MRYSSMMRHRQRQALALLPALDVGLQLGAEFLDGVPDRPARAVGQSADGRAGHDADAHADVEQDVEIVPAPLAAADAVDDLEHPAGPLPARRTLAAGLVGEESR